MAFVPFILVIFQTFIRIQNNKCLFRHFTSFNLWSPDNKSIMRLKLLEDRKKKRKSLSNAIQ